MISVNPGVHRMLLVVVDQLKSHSPACWISGVNLNQYLPIKNGGSAQPMAMLSIFWLLGCLVEYTWNVSMQTQCLPGVCTHTRGQVSACGLLSRLHKLNSLLFCRKERYCSLLG